MTRAAVACHRRARMRAGAVLLLAVLALAGCRREDPAAAAAAEAARQAQAEQAAEAQARQFEDAFARQDWSLARGYGDILMMEHPQSAAAARVRERLAEAKARLAEASEQRRLAALWSYQTEPVKGGNQRSAAIYARDRVETDGHGAHPVRLIFRDHPQWGRSSYLVLEAGDFDCYGGCRVQVAVDDGKPRAMAASRPKTDEAIAMFIEDERALWRLLQGAGTLSITFPVKAGGTRTARFEVGGLDRKRLPGWP